MIISPHKRLRTKMWLVLLTISAILLLVALLLRLLIPITDKDINESQFTFLLWIVATGILALMWITAVPVVLLWIRNLRYTIDEDRIIIAKGILVKTVQNIQYRMITDFVLRRSLFDRWLGIASIKIQTAGQIANASGYEGNLSGLWNWPELHEQLKEKVKRRDIQVSGTDHTGTSLNQTLQFILEEIRKIRKAIERSSK